MFEIIKKKLEELGENVQTGICKKGDTWDCLLVRKKKLVKNGKSKTDHSFYVSVSIIKENEIPEGLEFDVIEKMKELGFRESNETIMYGYTVDPNEVVVEICDIVFLKARKG